MARVTVEDCLEKVPNRFIMILVASKRARERLKSGESLSVSGGKAQHKATVEALREIAAGQVGAEILNEDTPS